MKRLSILALALISLTAFPQAVQAPNQDKKVSIVLTVGQVDLVLSALELLPYKDAAGVIQSIYGQAQKQLSDTTKKK